jgi:hypothetical protein
MYDALLLLQVELVLQSRTEPEGLVTMQGDMVC